MNDRRLVHQLFALGMLSAATLIFETSLTRFLAVAQFYHFSFLVVSLALLGFGASGTFLSVFPALSSVKLSRLLEGLSFCFAVSLVISYTAVNFLPFDSYSIAWDGRQVVYFLLYYLSLSLPFLISGLGIGAALSRAGEGHFRYYGANLIGSAIGTGLALVALSFAGVLGALLFSLLLIFLGGLLLLWQQKKKSLISLGSLLMVTITLVGFVVLGVDNLSWRAPLGMKISPYKGLAQILLHPRAQRLAGRWNAFSRVDLIADAELHTLPGLSYTYPGLPPEQIGFSLDAGPPQPITLTHPEDFQPADWLPEGVIGKLGPIDTVLVVRPKGGLGVLQALAAGSQSVTALVENPLSSQAAEFGGSYNIYSHPQVAVITGPARIQLERNSEQYPVVYLPLTDAYQPVASGAFSLREDYLLTVEGMESLLQTAGEQGVLIATRWIQYPPSEGLRLINTLVEALGKARAVPPGEGLVIFRGVQTITVMVKPAGWSPDVLKELRAHLAERRFDLVWAPDIKQQEVNRYNQLPEPVYYQAVDQLVQPGARDLFIQDYPFDISAPTDSQPFFFHFFTWKQTPEVLAAMGHTWQPYGGSGYFVLLALLGFVLLLSGGLILLPLWVGKRQLIRPVTPGKTRILSFFGLIGLGFMLLEVPLIQRWILILGYPEYAFAVVVGTLLLFSGLGSVFAGRGWLKKHPGWWGLLLLPGLGLPGLIWFGSPWMLGWPALGRWLLAIASIAPLGFLLGIPFPVGLSWIKNNAPQLGPLAWAVNGCASVIASVLATITALSFGYGVVLLAGSLMYLGAGLLYLTLPD